MVSCTHTHTGTVSVHDQMGHQIMTHNDSIHALMGDTVQPGHLSGQEIK